MKWLEKSDADRPFILPPSEYQSFTQTIDDLRLNMSALAASDAAAAQKVCQKFCASIQDGILAGQLSAEDMVVALEPFDTASHQAIVDMRVGKKLFAMIRSSIADALAATELSMPGTVSDTMWSAMFTYISNINGRFHDVACFKKLLAIMPQSAIAKISNETMLNYTKTFVQAQATRDHLNPAWSWCCSKIGTALSRLNDSQRLALSTSMEGYINNIKVNGETRMRTAFAWLLIQAYDTRMTDEAFAIIYKHTSERTMDPSGYRVWQLAIARLRSNGVLSSEVYREVAGWDFHDTLPQRWMALANALLKMERPEASIASLSRSLTDMGETWHLIEGLIYAHAENPCAETLRTVADASAKLEIQLALHIAANESNHNEWMSARWQVSDQQHNFEAFLAAPKAESYVWRAIKAKGGNTQAKMELIDLLSSLYISSSLLSRSQKMRRVQRAVAYQKALTGSVSPAVVRSAVSAVTLDLDAGLWGRDRLIRWATRLVREQVCPEAAHKMAKDVDGWRHMIEQSTTQDSAAWPDAFDVSAVKDAMTADVASETKGTASNRFTGS